MDVLSLQIPEVRLVRPHVHGDSRGRNRVVGSARSRMGPLAAY